MRAEPKIRDLFHCGRAARLPDGGADDVFRFRAPGAAGADDLDDHGALLTLNNVHLKDIEQPARKR